MCEPLSRRNSLLTGKNTAKFALKRSDETGTQRISVGFCVSYVTAAPEKPSRRTGNYIERIREFSSLLAVLLPIRFTRMKYTLPVRVRLGKHRG
jgi:hypothetical protein